MKTTSLFISAAVILLGVTTVYAGSKDLSAKVKNYYRMSTTERSLKKEALNDDTKVVLLKEAKEQIRKYYSPDSCRIRVKPRWIPSQLLQLKAEKITGVEIKGGVQQYTNFTVLYNRNNSSRRAEIQLELDVRKKVPVTVRRLQAGNKITAAVLTYQWIPIFKYNGPLIDDMGDLQGKVLKRTLLSGQPIRSSFISREYLVKAGDRVEMYVREGGLVVQISAEARESGAKGDEIHIYNNHTRRKYVAQVVRRGVVIWKKTL